MLGKAPSQQDASLPSAFSGIQYLISECLLQIDKKYRQLPQVAGSPQIYIPVAAGG